jgi:hypothetical protein
MVKSRIRDWDFGNMRINCAKRTGEEEGWEWWLWFKGERVSVSGEVVGAVVRFTRGTARTSFQQGRACYTTN